MGTKSSIEWTEATWNPLRGYTKISAGCKFCDAERMALRLQAMGQPNYANGFQLTAHEHALELPLRWKTQQMIFLNSMSDLFHENVPFAFIERIFGVMQRAHRGISFKFSLNVLNACLSSPTHFRGHHTCGWV